MAAETLRTDGLRNDEEAREGSQTLSIGTSHPKACCAQVLSNLTFVMLRLTNVCGLFAGTFGFRDRFPL
jgi:hypothetical protein